MTRLIGACGLVLAMLFASSPASAQTNTERIRAGVKPGQKVSITDDEGREVNGKIGDMTADALTVLDHGTRADVAYDRIVVGVGIDALIHRKREIYRRGSGAIASAAPVLGHGRRGMVMSVTW